MTAIYTLDGVSRTFKTGAGAVHAVDNIQLEIAQGEFVALEGPSGSGKSTMLQLLGALDRPSSGSLWFDGRDLGKLNERERTKIRRDALGFVFQSFNLIPTLTADENVEAALVPRKDKTSVRKEKVKALLHMVGLSRRAHHLPSRLSGGEQQRVAIARALANEPRVILADEPTGNLDSATSGELIDMLAKLSADNGVTLVLVTHAEEVASRASRRIAMRDGKLAEPLATA